MASHTTGNASGATPVIAQYLDIKEHHKDCLLFFQMGDFYELFFDDAKLAASELDIVLTYRGQYNNQDIPMCGVPVHNYASYSEKLVKKGYKIAVCEQTESPIEAKKRGYKAVVNRQVVRILTAGTLTEEHLLESRIDNFLCAVVADQQKFYCFFYDISTGKTHYFTDKIDTLKALLQHKKPSEIIYEQQEILNLLENIECLKTYQENDISYHVPALEPFSEGLDVLGKQAVSLLSNYLKRTQCHEEILIQEPEFQTYSDYLQLDSAGQTNLEIFKTVSGEKKPTLFSTLDKCATSAGARLLADYINLPLTDIDTINKRYDAINFFFDNPTLAKELFHILKRTADLNRILGRIKAGRGTPADLGHILNTLTIIYDELPSCHFEQYTDMPEYIIHAYNGLCTPLMCHGILKQALLEELPVSLKMGGFIASGYDSLLDEYKTLKENARQFILELEQKYKNITEISALKIKHNNVIGYHIDVSHVHSDRMLNQSFEGVEFIHKQTLANSVRFTTQELIGLEKKISEASLSFDHREKELFESLCKAVIDETEPLITFAHSIAKLDLFSSHALFALDNAYCRPVLTHKKSLKILGGRHPVIEDLLKKKSQKFVPNDALFKSDNHSAEIWLVTGPNMGGKSTYLRQTALMILMAQAGLFVPAECYQASIFDKIFSRVGASDNLAEGKSTFMSEMSETAHILNHATAHSFVILDELGRGTSTYDGLAIAYATLKFLSETICAMGLFATHYHELTEMISHHKRIGNLQATVTQHKENIIFLHKIAKGAAKKSYGLHVAELAGMPLEVVHAATDFLRSVDKQKMPKTVDNNAPALFDLADENTTDSQIIEINPVIEKIKQVNVNHLSPIEAFDFIIKIQEFLLKY